jgi:hypothetical protein
MLANQNRYLLFIIRLSCEDHPATPLSTPIIKNHVAALPAHRSGWPTKYRLPQAHPIYVVRIRPGATNIPYLGEERLLQAVWCAHTERGKKRPGVMKLLEQRVLVAAFPGGIGMPPVPAISPPAAYPDPVIASKHRWHRTKRSFGRRTSFD